MTRYYKPEDVEIIKDEWGNLLAYGVPGDDELNDKARKAVDVDRCPTCKSTDPYKLGPEVTDVCRDGWHRERYERDIVTLVPKGGDIDHCPACASVDRSKQYAHVTDAGRVELCEHGWHAHGQRYDYVLRRHPETNAVADAVQRAREQGAQ